MIPSNPALTNQHIEIHEYLIAEREISAKLKQDMVALIESCKRAQELLNATKRFIRTNPVSDYEVFYDEMECDSNCLAEDCEIAEDDCRAAIAQAEGKWEEKLRDDYFGFYVKCSVCGKTKPPRGRLVSPFERSWCDSWECEGYNKEPLPSSLFRGESEADFGYKVRL